MDKTTYKAGDLLSYADKKYVAAHASDATIAGYLSAQKLYKLPSIKDAFAEFCRLSQTKSKVVTGDKYGYGVSPSPTTLGNNSKTTYFTTGEVAIVCESLSAVRTIGETMKTLGKEWDVAPLYQYREFDADGRVKTVNGTRAVGKEAAHSYSLGYAIPANAKNKDAAWEFIRYMAGTPGQTAMMKTNTMVPNQISLANADEYLKDTSNFAPANKRAVVNMAGHRHGRRLVLCGGWRVDQRLVQHPEHQGARRQHDAGSVFLRLDRAEHRQAPEEVYLQEIQ